MGSSQVSPDSTTNPIIKLLNGFPVIEDDEVKDVVLLMGAASSGKTGAVQKITEDLTNITTAARGPGEDNRFGAPSNTSKEFDPRPIFLRENEAIGDSSTTTAFIDCPNFDNAREPEAEVAVNLFLYQVMSNVSRGKFIFLTDHSSVTSGSDGSSFDLLVSHATKFLKKIPTYGKSIGLVVTNVVDDNYLAGGGVSIVNGTVQFLQNYRKILQLQMDMDCNFGKVSKNEIERKIQFVEALLEKDDKEEYGRISYSGSLDHHPEKFLGTMGLIANLKLNGLEYSRVDWRDFDYSLQKRERTKMELGNYVTFLNEQVGKGISQLMNDFGEWSKNKFLEGTDMVEIAKKFRRAVEEMNSLFNSLYQLESSASPEKVLKLLKQCLEGLGYIVPSKLEKFVRQQESNFQFFDEVTGGKPVGREWESWVSPLKTIKKELEELWEWYDFCKDLQTTVGSYEFQARKIPLPEENKLDWLFFVEEVCQIPVGAGVRNLAAKLEKAHSNVVGEVMRFALKPAEVQHELEVTTISGNYVRLARFISNRASLLSVCRGDGGRKAKPVEIHASHTLFIDADLKAEGLELNISMFAPNLVVVGNEKQFNLNGARGAAHDPERADDGVYWDRDGKAGLVGKPGGSGGSFFGLARQTQDTWKLTITSVGGKGGDGQNGGNGMEGQPGRHATFEDSVVYDTVNVLFVEKKKSKHDGFPGGEGGDGGPGGYRGLGGGPGKIKLITGDDEPHQAKTTRLTGENGKAGKGGRGGEGGEHGLGIESVRTRVFGNSTVESTNVRVFNSRGPSGRNGKSGSSDLGYRWTPAPCKIQVWRSILSFKMTMRKMNTLEQSETKRFIGFLDNEECLRKYFNSEGFVNEMEFISQYNLEWMLPSFINRVEIYKQEQSMKAEDSKVVAYLLASAYSKLLTSEQDRRLGMVVDLSNFLNVVHKQMKKLKGSSALTMIEEERDTFGLDLKRKIEEVKRFHDEVVTPVIQKAELGLQSNLRRLEKQFEKLILDAESDLKNNCGRVADFRAAETLKFKQVLDAVGIILQVTAYTLEVVAILNDGPVWYVATYAAHGLTDMVEGMQSRGEGMDLGWILASGMRLLQEGSNLHETLQSRSRSNSSNGDELHNSTATDDDARATQTPTPMNLEGERRNHPSSDLGGGGMNRFGRLSKLLVTGLKDMTTRFTSFNKQGSKDNMTTKEVNSNQENNETTVAEAMTYLGGEVSTSLYSKCVGNSKNIGKLRSLVNEAEERLKEVRERKLRMEQSFIPVVKSSMDSLESVMSELQIKSESSSESESRVESTGLGIRRWETAVVLRDVKEQLGMLAKWIETKEFLDAIDMVQDALTMSIDLFEEIGKYEETMKLANYLAKVNSAQLKTIQVKDPVLSACLGKMDKAIVANSFMKDYQRALHAFKQWVFPFAKLHLTKDLELTKKNNVPDDVAPEVYMKQVEELQLKWERYRSCTLDAQDKHLIHTSFSSSHRSSRPFFVWSNQRYSKDIADFLEGKPIYWKADVRLSPKGKDAIKFKLIEINCKISEGRDKKNDQQALNSELEHFGVIMTHSGVSYYRFQGKFYVMTGENQTLRYHFERDPETGNRLGTNRIYEKFKGGEYLLSPYTLWTFQLVKAANHVGFQRLKRFVPFVDLELVGMGIYVDSERMKDDMEVDRYYVRDESVMEELDLYL